MSFFLYDENNDNDNNKDGDNNGHDEYLNRSPDNKILYQ